MTLTEFLLARIAEDERCAQIETFGQVIPADCWEPDRVLAECEAKRQIVDVVSTWNHQTVEDCWYSCAFTYGLDIENACCDDAREGTGCDCGLEFRRAKILGPLAAVYRDHPDYREEWRP